jgi:hypothetical protein
MIKSKQHFLPLLLQLLLKTLLQLHLLLPLILFNSIFCQINYSGTFKPSAMYRISDLSIISLPFRIAEMDIGLTKGNFDFKTISAIEYRWTGKNAEFDLREAYLAWYPSWGEVKIGKQIHAWGVVDGNNPTDNLNPYDYYYMFLPGTDRKIGTLSGSVIYYWNDWQFEAVVIPEHIPNRYPFGEEDFPIVINDPSNFIKESKKGNEYGFRLQTVFGNSDVGLSYFSGRDRGFTLIGYESGLEMVFPSFSYRKTNMLGMDFVSFIGDLTSRIEAGYFSTENDYKPNLPTLEKASYIQYAVQLEYITPNDITIMGQIIGSEILEVKGLSYDFSPIGGISPMSEDDFQQGMGTPFAMFTDLGMLLSVMGNYLDNTLEVRLNTFLDLEDSQTMLGGGVSYSPVENWEIDCSVSKLIGEEGTIFKEIEDFSHIQLKLAYSF